MFIELESKDRPSSVRSEMLQVSHCAPDGANSDLQKQLFSYKHRAPSGAENKQQGHDAMPCPLSWYARLRRASRPTACVPEEKIPAT